MNNANPAPRKRPRSTFSLKTLAKFVLLGLVGESPEPPTNKSPPKHNRAKTTRKRRRTPPVVPRSPL